MCIIIRYRQLRALSLLIRDSFKTTCFWAQPLHRGLIGDGVVSPFMDIKWYQEWQMARRSSRQVWNRTSLVEILWNSHFRAFIPASKHQTPCHMQSFKGFTSVDAVCVRTMTCKYELLNTHHTLPIWFYTVYIHIITRNYINMIWWNLMILMDTIPLLRLPLIRMNINIGMSWHVSNLSNYPNPKGFSSFAIFNFGYMWAIPHFEDTTYYDILGGFLK